MGNLSKNLSRQEFACNCGRCGNEPAVDSELVTVLQDICDHFAKERGLSKVTIIITRGYSCKEWNAYIWGGINKAREAQGKEPLNVPWDGKHPDNIAADFIIREVSASDVQKYLLEKYPDKYGIGIYPDRTHIDIRSTKSRW